MGSRGRSLLRTFFVAFAKILCPSLARRGSLFGPMGSSSSWHYLVLLFLILILSLACPTESPLRSSQAHATATAVLDSLRLTPYSKFPVVKVEAFLLSLHETDPSPRHYLRMKK